MKQRRLIYKLLAITLVISLTLGCDFVTQLFGSQGLGGPGGDSGSLATPGVYPAELDAPLPSPLAIPGGSPDDAAAALAKAVLADDKDSLAALVAAFEQSGIAIRAADGSLADKPAEPWQGLIYEAWEMRMLMNMLRHNAAVSINLGDLTQTVAAVIPELQGAPLEQLFVADIQADAQSEQPTKRFWARFIVELGRQAQAHPQYDLLGQVDPAAVNLDGIQTSLILRRLAADMFVYAGSLTTGMDTNPKGYSLVGLALMPAAEGNLPCTLSSTTKDIMDVTAFATKSALRGLTIFDKGWGGLFNYLENHGMKGAGAVGRGLGYGQIALTWAKFIYTYVALKAQISIDKEPLVRTKYMKPKTGDRQTLTAVVKMDVGDAQMFNCFRIMLNGAGLDFSVPQDGVLKGALVVWDGRQGFDQAAVLHGGSEALVQLVADSKSRIQEGGNPSSGINPVTNQVTDAEGKAYIGVEGIGQSIEVPDTAGPVSKRASVGMQVAVKAGNLTRDLVGVGVRSLGGAKALWTLPAEILQHMKWATSGSLSFEVTDWWYTGWKVDFRWTPGATLRFSGTICDPAKPFKLDLLINGPESLQEIIVVSFTPSSAEGGTHQSDGIATGVEWEATVHTPPQKYTIGGTEAAPALHLEWGLATATGAGATASVTEPKTYDIPLLPPDPGECGQP